MSQYTSDAAIVVSQDLSAVSRWTQFAMASLLGVLIVGMVGFAKMEVMHNAAHDTRHSFAFPCH
ncbi:CbtB domain-containing protein [Pseudomonas mohnii]